MLANSRVVAPPLRVTNVETEEEALAILARDRERAAVLAGGTDLLVKVKQGRLDVGHLVNCRWIPTLRGIRETAGGLEIAAATPLEELGRHPLVAREFPAIAEAVASIAGPAIRRMGTVGGNVVNASPAADTVVALAAYHASLALRGPGVERRLVAAGQFLQGPGKTARRPDELLTAVVLPRAGAIRIGHFRKWGRGAGDIATVNAAVIATADEGRLRWSVAVGAVAPTVLRLAAVEAMLNQATAIGPREVAEIRQAVAGAVAPIDDVRASAWYRRRLAAVLVSELVEQVWREWRELAAGRSPAAGPEQEGGR